MPETVHVRINKIRHPQHTAGAQVKSATGLISGTAAYEFAPDVNTAAYFSGATIMVSQIPAPVHGTLKISKPIARRKASKRARQSLEKKKFDMMPAYSERERQTPTQQPILLRAVNTSLAAKAEEEMSDFEREYPW